MGDNIFFFLHKNLVICPSQQLQQQQQNENKKRVVEFVARLTTGCPVKYRSNQTNPPRLGKLTQYNLLISYAVEF